MKIPTLVIKGTPLSEVKLSFCRVTPELAAEWLNRNPKNRRVKKKTVDAYAMDMRNGAWLPTHQGIAFDATGKLLDGQHRLLAIVQSKHPVTMLVTHGWPPANGGKHKTMDAVDRGVARSLADQLHLQHGIEPKEAARVVQICNGIASAASGSSRVLKSTTDSILFVFKQYESEIKWVMANPTRE
jgi:hypothetical protein